MVSASNNNSNDNLKKIYLTTHHKSLLFIGFLVMVFYTCTAKHLNNNNFDYLIFSQRWLPSACIEYVEKNSSSHHCVLPVDYDFWAIHGLWPTQNKHFGPFFCNKSMKFQVKVLQPIISDLELSWPNIEKGKGAHSLWKHEWEKHGSCAAQLDSLNNELKYFNKTLNFFKKYSIKDLFYKNNIQPSNEVGFNVLDIFNVIKNNFRKNPHISCIFEEKTHQAFLSEIRLCYDKSLELMDCEEVNSRNFRKNEKLEKTLTNCPLDSQIIIPETINIFSSRKSLSKNYKPDYYDNLLTFLQIIRFLQWASL